MGRTVCYHDYENVIMKASGMVRTQIQLTESQARELKRLAAARGVSMAEIIRQGVDAVLRSKPFPDAEERRKKALALAGMYRSGKSDVSKRHDKYLAEDFGG
jgi:hypothetical protein